MITIFRGRKLSLHGSEEVIYAEVAVALRDQIHHFNTGKSCNPFAVFMKIALHTDENGWAFPGNRSISASTGISTAHALASARTHLQNVRIDDHRVLEVYRERRPDGTFGRHLYRIFPDAWADGLEQCPSNIRHGSSDPARDGRSAAFTGTNNQMSIIHMWMSHMRRNHMRIIHNIRRTIYPRSTRIKDPAPPGLTPQPPTRPRPSLRTGPATGRRRGYESPGRVRAMRPLAQFIEAHSKYRFKVGGQHDRLLRIVPDRDRQHPAPNELYLDEEGRGVQSLGADQDRVGQRAGGTSQAAQVAGERHLQLWADAVRVVCLLG